MNKYLLSGLSGAALLLLVSSPVSAFGLPGMHWPPMPSGPEIVNEAVIDNNVSLYASTGDNSQMTYGKVGVKSGGTGTVLGENVMLTGNASGVSLINNMANIGDDCGCVPGADILNKANIDNDVEASVSTGFNSQKTIGKVSVMPKVMVQPMFHHFPAPAVQSGEGTVAGSNSLQTGSASARSEIWNLVNSSYAMAQ